MKRRLLFFICVSSLFVAVVANGFSLRFRQSVPQSVPDSVKQKYSYLYQEEVRQLPDGSYAFHDARLFYREGIRVLHLKGDAFEMAFQHGKLLRSDIRKGALPATARLVPNIIANTFGDRPLLVKLADFYIEKTVTNAVIKNAFNGAGTDSQPQLDQAYGLSEATGISVGTILKALFAPDTFMLLAAQRGGDQREMVLANPILSNCSDFAAWGKYTQDGEMVIGRNLDYPLNGYYDAFPTVIYFDPEEEGAQRYMSVVSAGVHNAGMTAINEAGIFLGVHTIPSSDVSSDGMPVFIVANEVIRRARTFDEAILAFKNNLPTTGYAYTVVSTKERRVAAVELSNQHVAVRESGNQFHVQSNHYITPEMKPHYLHVNDSIDLDSYARFDRIKQLIEENQSNMDERVAMAILGDKFDPFSKRVRGYGNTVAVHTTMTSVVVVPGKGRIFVANGKGPVSHGKYVGFPTVEHFDVDGFLSDAYRVYDNGAFQKLYPNLAEAEQLFIEAKKAYEYNNDTTTALYYLRKAVGADPENPNYHFLRGIFALKEGEYSEAKRAFDTVTKMDHTPETKMLAHYYRGRIYAHFRQRAKAMEEFHIIVENPKADRKLQKAAKKAIQKTRFWPPYRIRPKKLHVLMQQCDMQDYN